MITVVLDDDPTGTQAMRDVSVILDWDDPAAWDAIEAGDRAVHVLTNARAFDGAQAGELVHSAAGAALDALRARGVSGRFVLRGDSTLRAHVSEEYDALRAVLYAGEPAAPLLLVPALPAAGRVTIDGVHLIERDGTRTPLHETEYARDGALAYASAELAQWAAERSGGRLAAADAEHIGLEELRGGGGAERVAAALSRAHARGRPAVVIPDAETTADLRTIAAGVAVAEAAGTPFLVRCAPAFVAALTGADGAESWVTPPAAGNGILVVCGSFVPTTTAQMERLAARFPEAIIPAGVASLAAAGAESEIDRVCAGARTALGSVGIAAVVTDRVRDPALVGADAQRRVAAALATVAARVRASVVIAKGGITSAVTAREGLGAHVARVLGPIVAGVAVWRLGDGTDYLVVPGNVGGADLLVDLITRIRRP